MCVVGSTVMGIYAEIFKWALELTCRAPDEFRTSRNPLPEQWQPDPVVSGLSKYDRHRLFQLVFSTRGCLLEDGNPKWIDPTAAAGERNRVFRSHCRWRLSYSQTSGIGCDHPDRADHPTVSMAMGSRWSPIHARRRPSYRLRNLPSLTVAGSWLSTVVSTVMLAVSITIRFQTHPADQGMVQSAGLIDIGDLGMSLLFRLTTLSTLADPMVRVAFGHRIAWRDQLHRSRGCLSAPIDPSLTVLTGEWSRRSGRSGVCSAPGRTYPTKPPKRVRDPREGFCRFRHDCQAVGMVRVSAALA